MKQDEKNVKVDQETLVKIKHAAKLLAEKDGNHRTMKETVKRAINLFIQSLNAQKPFNK